MSRSRSIDSIEVKEPCNESWEKMHGDGKVRACAHCQKNVNFISAMSRKEVRKLVRRSKGQLCVRYIKRPDSNRPLFANDLVQIVRRAPRLAAGVIGATISMATMTFAQGSIQPTKTTGSEKVSELILDREPLAFPAGNSSIRGTLIDPNGAVIPGVRLEVRNEQGGQTRTVVSDSSGNYLITDLPKGKYTLTAEAAAFVTKQFINIELNGNSELLQDIPLEISSEVLIVGALAVSSGPLNTSDLAKAIYDQDLQAVLELLAIGADPNENKAEEEESVPVLFIAVDEGNIDIVRALLNFGADIHAKDRAGNKILFWIDDDTPSELVELLISYNADVNAVDDSDDETSVLLYAIEHSTVDSVRKLVEAGANVNYTDKKGWTPLMIAAYEDDIEMVRTLLKAGADVHARNLDGETAWDQTAEEEIEKLLESHGAIPTPEDGDDEEQEETDDT